MIIINKIIIMIIIWAIIIVFKEIIHFERVAHSSSKINYFIRKAMFKTKAMFSMFQVVVVIIIVINNDQWPIIDIIFSEIVNIKLRRRKEMEQTLSSRGLNRKSKRFTLQQLANIMNQVKSYNGIKNSRWQLEIIFQ